MKFCTLFLAGFLAVAATAAAQSNSKVVATVNGDNITEQQLQQAASGELSKLDANRPQPQSAYDRARLEILWKHLDSLVEDKLIDAQVKKGSMTREQLLNAEIDSNVETPSPEEVEQFYEANKAQISVPKAQALPQVRQYMIDSSRKRYHDILINNLRRNFKVVTYLDPLRANVVTAGYPSRGPANAPVTIVEFADFECPYCGALYPTMKQIEKNYADKVRLVYRQYPLTNVHRRAQKAAEASLCANEQKKFWDFYDSLFSNQNQLEDADLKQRAKTLGLNTTEFNSCLDSGKQAEAIQKDKDDAKKLGVSSTPTTFINGRLVSGVRSYAEIREVIDDELKRAEGK
jgi:protein-disulfide isomerase/Skp family chaperone for outer membrane proteins